MTKLLTNPKRPTVAACYASNIHGMCRQIRLMSDGLLYYREARSANVRWSTWRSFSLSPVGSPLGWPVGRITPANPPPRLTYGDGSVLMRQDVE